jgi:hypothetical protein
MIFRDVLKDIENLRGKRLLCISAKAMPLEIIEVNAGESRILVRASNGAEQTRSFQELERVWDVLQEKTIIHVDSDALHGGGSMRNQPETIFANLPYIEYLIIDRKKHLFFTGKPTHALGTLKQMESIHAQQVISRFKRQSQMDVSPTILLVVNDLKAEIDQITRLVGIAPEALLGQPGVYKFYKLGVRALITDRTIIPVGTYIILRSNRADGEKLKLEMDGYEFFWPRKDLRVLIAAISQ